MGRPRIRRLAIVEKLVESCFLCLSCRECLPMQERGLSSRLLESERRVQRGDTRRGVSADGSGEMPRLFPLGRTPEKLRLERSIVDSRSHKSWIIDLVTSRWTIAGEELHREHFSQNRLKGDLTLLSLRRRESYTSSDFFADSSFLVIVLCDHPLQLQLEHFLL